MVLNLVNIPQSSNLRDIAIIKIIKAVDSVVDQHPILALKTLNDLIKSTNTKHIQQQIIDRIINCSNSVYESSPELAIYSLEKAIEVSDDNYRNIASTKMRCLTESALTKKGVEKYKTQLPNNHKL